MINCHYPWKEKKNFVPCYSSQLMFWPSISHADQTIFRVTRCTKENGLFTSYFIFWETKKAQNVSATFSVKVWLWGALIKLLRVLMHRKRINNNNRKPPSFLCIDWTKIQKYYLSRGNIRSLFIGWLHSSRILISYQFGQGLQPMRNMDAKSVRCRDEPQGKEIIGKQQPDQEVGPVA